MQLPADALSLRIFIGESDRHGHRDWLAAAGALVTPEEVNVLYYRARST